MAITRRQAMVLLLQASRPDGMALIPGGEFQMGTDADSIDTKYSNFGPRIREMLRSETPRHRVRVESFYMGRCEVTNAQFQAFVDANPQWLTWKAGRYPDGTAEFPVTYVSWFAAVAYASWAGKRLPSEAEWEYAARGGLPDSEYPWGDEPPSPDRANYAASGHGSAIRVGQYKPNGYGLFDMAGNVWEYCADEWVSDYSPAALRDKTRRVIRGGSWGGSPVNLRVAFRDSHPATGPGPHVGFRCVSLRKPESRKRNGVQPRTEWHHVGSHIEDDAALEFRSGGL
jgi:formylglycine-generating enzyme required for sulfatase activity